MRCSTILVLLVACLALFLPRLVAASRIKPDETIIFFPTSTYFDKASGNWILPIHGWVFEPEEDSVWRGALINRLLGLLELDESAPDNQLFRERARYFLVDNERGKSIRLQIQNKRFRTKRSKANGHFRRSLTLPAAIIDSNSTSQWLGLQARLPKGDTRGFTARTQVLSPKGLSIISDIDDTIKFSDVLNKKALLANTFLHEYQTIDGMATAYAAWHSKGAAFHYVSSSPWQLYPALSEFLQHSHYPAGSMHLRDFRLKDKTFFNLFTSSEITKPPIIKSLLRSYPQRRFILVGDSGEKDPEVYGAIAREYSAQVEHIFIRLVTDETKDSARMQQAFQHIPAQCWTLFHDPEVLRRYQIEP